MNLYWELEVFYLEDVLQGLDYMEKAFGTFRVPLQKSAERAAESIGENIVRGGIPDPFTPLAPSTLYETARFRLGGPLYRVGKLAEAASDTTGNVPGSAFMVTDSEARAGIDENSQPLGFIARVMTDGSPARNVPARPFVRLLPSDIAAIEGYFADYAEDVVNQAFKARRG